LKLKKTISAAVLFVIMATSPLTCRAASSLEVVFTDSLWGTVIGALAASATLAFVDHPSDHCERILHGAAVGLFLGIGFGIYEISPTFASNTRPDGEHERVYGLAFRLPMPGDPRPSRPGLWSW
jgi:hypothetical protein